MIATEIPNSTPLLSKSLSFFNSSDSFFTAYFIPYLISSITDPLFDNRYESLKASHTNLTALSPKNPLLPFTVINAKTSPLSSFSEEERNLKIAV